jgi:hypothetical protein
MVFLAVGERGLQVGGVAREEPREDLASRTTSRQHYAGDIVPAHSATVRRVMAAGSSCTLDRRRRRLSAPSGNVSSCLPWGIREDSPRARCRRVARCMAGADYPTSQVRIDACGLLSQVCFASHTPHRRSRTRREHLLHGSDSLPGYLLVLVCTDHSAHTRKSAQKSPSNTAGSE